MTEASAPPPKPLRTWRPMAAWTAGILLALGLVWFVAAVVVPVWQVRIAVKKYSQGWFTRNPGGRDNWCDYDLEHPMISGLGGSRLAAQRLGQYLRFPEIIAPRKRDAFSLLLNCDHEDAIPQAWPMLSSTDPKLRAGAVYFLGHFDADAGHIVPELISALDDADADVRLYAAMSLGARGAAARRALPALERLAERDEAARYYTNIAIQDIRTEATRADGFAAEALKKVRGEAHKP